MWRLIVLSVLTLTATLCPAQQEYTEDWGCGWYGGERAGGDGQIEGRNDEVPQFGELPWLVTIIETVCYNDSEEDEADDCEDDVKNYSGILIHPRAVLISDSSNIHEIPPGGQDMPGGQGLGFNGLTHCITRWEFDRIISAEALRVRPGAPKPDAFDSKINDPRDRNVSDIINHKDDSGLVITILILSSPVELSENVGVVCLPRDESDYDTSRCFVSGWIKEPNEPASQMKRSNIRVIPRVDCGNDFNADKNRNGAGLRPSSRCYNEHYFNKCQVNFGSPLICPLVKDPERYALIGFDITVQCHDRGINALSVVFADILAARELIDYELSSNNFDTLVYTAYASTELETF